MPRMFPEHIPEDVRLDPARVAERQVYEALSDQLSDDYSVFAWCAWLIKSDSTGASDGEADFVIASRRGFLCLEVKGGGISRDSVAAQWHSVDRRGIRHEIKDPVAQAKRSKFALMQKLKEQPPWQTRRITAGHAVAFPAAELREEFLGADLPREILICRQDIPVLHERVEQMLDYWNQRDHSRDLGPEGVGLLERLVAPTYELPLALGGIIDEHRREFARLTEGQFRVLRMLGKERRVLITGSAGTGKTLIALEKAKQMAAEGFRTLLTCFNRPLADYLRAQSGGNGSLVVENFHRLCYLWAARAQLQPADPDEDGPHAADESYFRVRLPDMMLEAIAHLSERFDAIVVDEGQDFTDNDRAVLELLQSDRDNPVLYVFQDVAQGIYKDKRAWIGKELLEVPLDENLRNSRCIQEVLAHLTNQHVGTSDGPEGFAPELIAAGSEKEQVARTSQALHKLIREKAVRPRDIAILVTSRNDFEWISPDGRIGAFQVTHDSGSLQDVVLVESIPRLKGLERPIVILVGLHPNEYIEFDSLLYVGASRAQSHLIIIAEPEVLQRFRVGTQ